jgi:selenocysteine-specific translation elongation factor
MKHLTIGIFGDKEFTKKIAKPGTVNDIMMYNHASSGGVFSYASPNSQENKIQTLLQTVNLVDVPVVVSDVITKELAEQIIAIDSLGFEKGFIISNSEDLKAIIKGTTLEKFEWVKDEKELREKLMDIDPVNLSDKPWFPVDNYFDVKSVGTVVLSVSRGAAIKKYDKILVQPLGKEVMIKGIQSQDKDLEQTEKGVRVGLNLKGVEADELKRGYVLCGEANVSKSIDINFCKNRYTKESLESGMQIFLSVGLQVNVGKVVNAANQSLSVALEAPIAYLQNQKCIIASTKQNMPRILGSGIMK